MEKILGSNLKSSPIWFSLLWGKQRRFIPESKPNDIWVLLSEVQLPVSSTASPIYCPSFSSFCPCSRTSSTQPHWWDGPNPAFQNWTTATPVRLTINTDPHHGLDRTLSGLSWLKLRLVQATKVMLGQQVGRKEPCQVRREGDIGWGTSGPDMSGPPAICSPDLNRCHTDVSLLLRLGQPGAHPLCNTAFTRLFVRLYLMNPCIAVGRPISMWQI